MPSLPSLAVVAPIAVPLLAAAVVAGFGFRGRDLGRVAAAVGAWGSVAALLALWLSVRSTQELNLGPLGFGSNLNLRVDAVAFAFGLMVAVPAAMLLTLQRRPWQESVLGILALAAAMAAIEAGGVVLTAIAGGTAATLCVLLLDTEDIRAPRPRWSAMLAAWLALAWAGTIFQVRGGTAVYDAIPVSALTSPAFALVAVSSLLASGLFPWRPWPAELWARPSLAATGLTVATVYPLGFYLLVRAYEMGNGRYPSIAFNVVLASLGVLVALGSAVRAQGAGTRREFFGEVIPAFGGFALVGIALGTPLALVAGLLTLATAAALAACLPLVPERDGLAPFVAIAAAIGLPPGLAFGVRVLGIESTFEGGDLLGLIGLAAVSAWALWMVAGARAVGLPAATQATVAEAFPGVALAIAIAVLAAGPALAALSTGFASPAQADVMSSTSPAAPSLISVITVTTTLPAAAMFIPLLLIGFVAYAAAGTSLIRGQARPALFELPAGRWRDAVVASLRSATVPEQYRSLVDLGALESTVAAGRPVLWLATLVALAFAVTR